MNEDGPPSSTDDHVWRAPGMANPQAVSLDAHRLDTVGVLGGQWAHVALRRTWSAPWGWDWHAPTCPAPKVPRWHPSQMLRRLRRVVTVEALAGHELLGWLHTCDCQLTVVVDGPEGLERLGLALELRRFVDGCETHLRLLERGARDGLAATWRATTVEGHLEVVERLCGDGADAQWQLLRDELRQWCSRTRARLARVAVVDDDVALARDILACRPHPYDGASGWRHGLALELAAHETLVWEAWRRAVVAGRGPTGRRWALAGALDGHDSEHELWNSPERGGTRRLKVRPWGRLARWERHMFAALEDQARLTLTGDDTVVRLAPGVAGRSLDVLERCRTVVTRRWGAGRDRSGGTYVVVPAQLASSVAVGLRGEVLGPGDAMCAQLVARLSDTLEAGEAYRCAVASLA